MTRKPLSQRVQTLFRSAKDRAQDLATNHKLEVGAVEMAVGAALLAWGVHEGVAEMGVHVVATHLNIAGGAAGGLVGATLAVVGAIGIVGMGGAIGVPAAFLAGGASVLLSSLGYTVGDLAGKLIDPSWLDQLKGPSVALLGVALLIDGARRIAGDDRLAEAGARIRAATLELSDCTQRVVARTKEELKGIASELVSLPEDGVDAAGSIASTVTLGATGYAVASSLSAASVTVAGSHALGGVALSLGLVSAPLWPAIVGTVALAGLGYTTWKVAKRIRRAAPNTQPPLLSA